MNWNAVSRVLAQKSPSSFNKSLGAAKAVYGCWVLCSEFLKHSRAGFPSPEDGVPAKSDKSSPKTAPRDLSRKPFSKSWSFTANLARSSISQAQQNPAAQALAQLPSRPRKTSTPKPLTQSLQ
jgi:hypothetical protein